MGSVLEKVLLAFFKMYMFIKLFSYKKSIQITNLFYKVTKLL